MISMFTSFIFPVNILSSRFLSCVPSLFLFHFSTQNIISYGSRALEHRLSNCGARVYLLPCVWDLPRSGIKLCLPHWLLLLSRLSHVQLCATLWTTVCQAPLSRDSPGENPGVGCCFLLQGIFLTQESNPGLLHCRQTLYRRSYKGSPTLMVGACIKSLTYIFTLVISPLGIYLKEMYLRK